jgi:hypothetical protein
VLEASVLHGDLRFTLRLIENGMAYITFRSDDLPVLLRACHRDI